MKLPWLIVCGICLLLISCKKKETPILFSLEKNSGIDFTNTLTSTKKLNVFNYRNFYNGGGVAVGDLNNDGLPEIFFTSNQGANKLYLNKGNFHFEDISLKAGFPAEKKQWSTGVVFADVNGDGWLDIYVCNAGNPFDPSLRKNQLYINNKNLTFTEEAMQYGLDQDGYTTQATFFDYDLDGDLDCYLINNSPIPANTLNYANMRDVPIAETRVPDFLKGGGDHLFRNDGGKFIEVTRQAGIHGGLISLGLGATVGDVNNDGYPDIYVSNDFFERDYLYLNQQNGTFHDDFENCIQHASLSSMGADIADVNNDGYPDIFTTDMLPDDDHRLKTKTSFDNYDVYRIKQQKGFYNQFTHNALQVNNGNGRFLETAFYSGVAASDWSWGALMFDADNDGLTDLFVCNGIARDVTDQDFMNFFGNEVIQQMVITGKKEDVNKVVNSMPSVPIPNKAYQNRGHLTFKDVGEEWGLSAPSFSNGAVYADLDNDGDLDLVINNANEKAAIYRNKSREMNQNNFVSISLKYKTPNLFAVGSKIEIYCGDQVLTREVIPSRGFQSCVEHRQTIGLGKRSIDSMVITWPDRTVSSMVKPAINQEHIIDYTSLPKRSMTYRSRPKQLFTNAPANFDKHNEDDFIDFYFERNVPFMLSRQGPKAAVADVNGDGLQDIFIGGARDQESQLYIQTSNGFQKKEIPDLKTFSFNDVTVAFFFDANGDGYPDLFTGGGGNFAPASAGNFQNQLFINDGKGNFKLKRGALPAGNSNCGAAVSFDFDGDGAMDLFIGSRSIPQNYGATPQSYLLRNDGKGNFKDVTSTVAPSFSSLGMVTSVALLDVDKDGKNDLVVVGDYMSPTLFSFNGKQFVKKDSGLENLFGWWQTVQVADLNNDGYPDMILGNIGDNFYLKADSANPVKLWLKDFDGNGTIDKVFSRSIHHRDMPVFMKKEMTDQMPSLKKLNLKNEEYAGKTVQQLFGDGLKDAAMKQINFTSSVVAYNDGRGHFTVARLPLEGQLSSVNAVLVKDINQDGYPDIIAGGNWMNLLPQFSSIDASYGLLFLNDGKGHFKNVPSSITGLNVAGETRDIVSFRNEGQDYILFLQNNDYPVMYQINQ